MDCYDCPDEYCGLFSTEEKALEYINKYTPSDRANFYIEVATIDAN